MTPDQRRAATSRSERCYVKAGPGSGKTYLATEGFGFLRYRRYVTDRRGILGVIDGFSPQGVEDEEGIAWRKDFLRVIGYKVK